MTLLSAILNVFSFIIKCSGFLESFLLFLFISFSPTISENTFNSPIFRYIFKCTLSIKMALYQNRHCIKIGTDEIK